MCERPENIPLSPHRRHLKFQGVEGPQRLKNVKLNCNFQRGGVVFEKIPSVGEVHEWIFLLELHDANPYQCKSL